MAESITEIEVMTGVVDCHFERNARIALQNFQCGRPLFEGAMPPTVIPDPRYPAGFMVAHVNG